MGLQNQLIDERYELLARAGRGAAGEVFRALDRATSKPVAVKLLHHLERSSAKRFDREAQLLSLLRHSAIVEYVAHGETDRGPYLVMEWLEGRSLADRLADGPLSVAETVALGIGIGKGLRVAHWRDIIHRDLKPSNLFLTEGDTRRPKILDFGIARLKETHASTITETGVTLGTPGYLSPEQARGDKGIDVRADIFALGCVLFHCIAGRSPFVAQDPISMLLKVVLEDPPPLDGLVAGVPKGLQALIESMLCKDRGGRPADAEVVVDELEALAKEPARSAPSVHAPSLTTNERRLVCVLIARGPTKIAPRPSVGDLKATVPMVEEVSTETGDARLLTPLVSPLGIEVRSLGQGTHYAEFSRDGDVREAVRAAATAALDLSRMAPTVGVVLLVRRVDPEHGFMGDIDAVMPLLTRPGAPRLDDKTQALVELDFVVEHDAHGPLLRGARRAPDVDVAAPLLGREELLAHLRTRLEAAFAHAQPAGIGLLGPTGIGKTRLCHAVGALASRGAVPALVLSGRGDPMTRTSGLGILVAMVREALGLSDGEAPEVGRRKLVSAVAALFPSSERTRITSFLGELLGLCFAPEGCAELSTALHDPELMAYQQRRALFELLVAQVRRGPLVLVVEDAEHADPASLVSLGWLFAELGRGALFMVVTARSEAALTDWMKESPTFEAVELSPLSADASRELVRQAGGATSPQDEERVVRQGAGNPLHLLELVRAAGAPEASGAPGAVVALVESRFAALPNDERRVIRAASVFGHVFWEHGLRELLGAAEGTSDLGAMLAGLEARGIVFRCAHSRIAGEHQYAFRQAELRACAYEALTAEDRQLGHRLAGEWLARVAPGDPRLIAEHLERAGRASHALFSFCGAAEQALASGDLEAAAELAKRGEAAGAAGEVLGGLLAVRVEAASMLGEHVGLDELTTRALSLLPEGTALWCRVAKRLGNHHAARGDLRALGKLGEQLLSVLKKAPSVACVAALSGCATRLWLSSGLDRARRLLKVLAELAPERFGPADRKDPRLDAYRHLARSYLCASDDPWKHRAELQLALTAFERAGDAREATVARLAMVLAELELGGFEAAEAIAAEAVRGAEAMQLRAMMPALEAALGIAQSRQGRLGEARVRLERAVDASDANGDSRTQGRVLIELSRLSMEDGDPRRALALSQRAERVLGRQPALKCLALAQVAFAALSLGQEEQAKEAIGTVERILAVLDRLESGEAFVHRIRYLVHERLGDARRAARAAEMGEGQLLNRADRIPELGARQAFLHRVREHQELLRCAVALRNRGRIGTQPVG